MPVKPKPKPISMMKSSSYPAVLPHLPVVAIDLIPQAHMVKASPIDKAVEVTNQTQTESILISSKISKPLYASHRDGWPLIK